MKAGGRHVSPAWIIRMDRSRVNPHAAPQCAPGARVGAVELRDCAHPVVWAPHSRDLSGPADGAKGGHGRTAALRMVLRYLSQSGRQTADPGRHHVFCPLAVLDCDLVDRDAPGLGPRRHQPGAWRREWLRLLRGVRPAIPPDWTVLVLADRGLWARWLFGRIVRLGWHPLLRINNGAKFRPAGQTQWYGLRALVRDVNQCWCGRGTAFVSPARRVDCTLVAWWGEGYTEPWFLLTDLAPEASAAAWYGLRR